MWGRAVVCRVALTWVMVSLGLCRMAGAQSVPAPWAAVDIGGPALAGSASASSNVFTIRAAGVDIWGTADQFRFVYQQITGDVDVRARVDSVSYAAAWSKAGVMIRSSLGAGAAHGFALVSAGKGAAFQRRTSNSGLSTNTAGPFVAPPQWVRLVRSGSTLTAYSSADGVAWTTIGTDTVQLGATAYVGIAVTSHTATALTTASVSSVGVLQSSSQSGLPAGQAARDIGSPPIAGATSYAGGRYTIAASGADIWGTADQFHYVYQQASGDVDVKLRVASVSYADRWSKAGVMIRQSLSADSAHGYALVSAGRGYAFQRRPLAGNISANTAGSTGRPPGWVRLKRTGNLLTAYESVDGVTWNVIGSDSIVLSDPFYVGIAVTSHSTAATTAVADNFSVTSVLTPVNQVPTVSLSVSSSAYTAPATIALTAAASDPENQMNRVEFYNGSALLASDPTAPYSMTWSNVAAGTYSLTAIAYDAAGQSTRSSPVSVTVTTATLAPPKGVTFQASADHATLTSYRVEVFAAGVNTATATPLASIDVGKPAPNSNNDITVSVATFFTPLASGTYQLTVAAVSGSQFTRSAPLAFTK